jgi:hypothetical protein
MKTALTRAAVAAAAIVGTLGLAVPAASAAPAPPSVTATTHLTNRADSGGNGDWATDTMTRKLVITQTGRTGNVRDFTATVTDTGSFITTYRAYTPNQGGADLGRRIDAWLTGSLAGKAAYAFTATAAPAAGLVPAAESGTPASGPKTTSLWYEQAFPAGTIFGGAGIGTWGWNYTAASVGILFGGGFTLCTEHWSDASVNNGGQTANSGDITGSCPAY